MTNESVPRYPIKLVVSIVERGKGVAMQRLYNARQVFLHLQCAGRGTATSEIMDILGLGSSEKDVVLSFADANCSQRLLHALDSELRRNCGTAGIVFTLPLSALNNMTAALLSFKANQTKRELGGDPVNPQKTNALILVSCSRGRTDEIMATAKAHGARGGTVVRARLAGLTELEQAYNIDLNAERDIVAIVIPSKQRSEILDAINTAHGLRTPAQAILCALPIDEIVRLG